MFGWSIVEVVLVTSESIDGIIDFVFGGRHFVCACGEYEITRLLPEAPSETVCEQPEQPG